MKKYEYLQSLLDEIVLIGSEYRKKALVPGSGFNVFNTLNIRTRETSLHSPILVDLLNCKGSHGCGTLFLNAFLEQQILNLNKYADFAEKLKLFESNSSKAQAEKSIQNSYVDEDRGRIDILLKDPSNHTIIIENKIYAPDQDKQLVRYHKAYPDAPIFYLNLRGNPPSKKSIGRLKEGDDFVCISYKKDIISWLESCLTNITSIPSLYEIIIQYVSLLKELTDQTMNKEMDNNLVSFITSKPEYLKAAYDIINSQASLEKRIIEEFATSLKNEFKEPWIIEDREFNEKYGELWFYKESWKQAVVLYFGNEYPDLSIGIYRKDDTANKDKVLSAKIGKRLTHIDIGRVVKDSDWVWLSSFDAWSNTYWPEVNEGELLKQVSKAIKDISLVIDALKS